MNSCVCVCVCVFSPPGTHVTANGKKVLNMVSANFLGFAGDQDIQVATAQIQTAISLQQHL